MSPTPTRRSLDMPAPLSGEGGRARGEGGRARRVKGAGGGAGAGAGGKREGRKTDASTKAALGRGEECGIQGRGANEDEARGREEDEDEDEARGREDAEGKGSMTDAERCIKFRSQVAPSRPHPACI